MRRKRHGTCNSTCTSHIFILRFPPDQGETTVTTRSTMWGTTEHEQYIMSNNKEYHARYDRTWAVHCEWWQGAPCNVFSHAAQQVQSPQCTGTSVFLTYSTGKPWTGQKAWNYSGTGVSLCTWCTRGSCWIVRRFQNSAPPGHWHTEIWNNFHRCSWPCGTGHARNVHNRRMLVPYWGKIHSVNMQSHRRPHQEASPLLEHGCKLIFSALPTINQVETITVTMQRAEEEEHVAKPSVGHYWVVLWTLPITLFFFALYLQIS